MKRSSNLNFDHALQNPNRAPLLACPSATILLSSAHWPQSRQKNQIHERPTERTSMISVNARAGMASLVAGLSLLAATAQGQSDGSLVYTFTTFAGFPGAGSDDGVGSNAQFDSPQGVAVDHAGNVYVADTVNDTIRKITPAGIVTTIAGFAETAGLTDGTN